MVPFWLKANNWIIWIVGETWNRHLPSWWEKPYRKTAEDFPRKSWISPPKSPLRTLTSVSRRCASGKKTWNHGPYHPICKSPKAVVSYFSFWAEGAYLSSKILCLPCWSRNWSGKKSSVGFTACWQAENLHYSKACLWFQQFSTRHLYSHVFIWPPFFETVCAIYFACGVVCLCIDVRTF